MVLLQGRVYRALLSLPQPCQSQLHWHRTPRSFSEEILSRCPISTQPAHRHLHLHAQQLSDCRLTNVAGGPLTYLVAAEGGICPVSSKRSLSFSRTLSRGQTLTNLGWVSPWLCPGWWGGERTGCGTLRSTTHDAKSHPAPPALDESELWSHVAENNAMSKVEAPCVDNPGRNRGESTTGQSQWLSNKRFIVLANTFFKKIMDSIVLNQNKTIHK